MCSTPRATTDCRTRDSTLGRGRARTSRTAGGGGARPVSTTRIRITVGHTSSTSAVPSRPSVIPTRSWRPWLTPSTVLRCWALRSDTRACPLSSTSLGSSSTKFTGRHGTTDGRPVGKGWCGLGFGGPSEKPAESARRAERATYARGLAHWLALRVSPSHHSWVAASAKPPNRPCARDTLSHPRRANLETPGANVDACSGVSLQP